MGDGIHGELTIQLPREAVSALRAQVIVVPAEWPPDLVIRGGELPEVGDFLPCELRYRASSLTEASKALGLRDEAVAESEVIDGEVRLVIHGFHRHPTTVDDLLTWMRDRLASREELVIADLRLGGRLQLSAYFESFDDYATLVYPWLLIARVAAQLGGAGSGYFLWDGGSVPVCCDVQVGADEVHVTIIDPQDARELYERTHGSRAAITERREEWLAT